MYNKNTLNSVATSDTFSPVLSQWLVYGLYFKKPPIPIWRVSSGLILTYYPYSFAIKSFCRLFDYPWRPLSISLNSGGGVIRRLNTFKNAILIISSSVDSNYVSTSKHFFIEKIYFIKITQNILKLNRVMFVLIICMIWIVKYQDIILVMFSIKQLPPKFKYFSSNTI